MKYFITGFILFFFIACNAPADDLADNNIAEPQPEVKLNPLQTAIREALIDIWTKDLKASGEVIKNIQIQGMEIIKISQKDYYINEMAEQETNFESYLEYLKKFSKTPNPLNNPQQLEVSKAKHKAVMVYLKKVIKTASTNPDLYKVVYYLKAETDKIKYDQKQTIFLDKELKKVVSDYGFLG